jgi:hypothetical protein
MKKFRVGIYPESERFEMPCRQQERRKKAIEELTDLLYDLPRLYRSADNAGDGQLPGKDGALVSLRDKIKRKLTAFADTVGEKP